MATAHSEIDRILLDPAELAAAEAGFYSADELCRLITADLGKLDAALESDPRWRHLLGSFDLRQPAADLLTLAVAAELDPDLRRVYGYLADEPVATHPTVRHAMELFGWKREELLDPRSGVFVAGLLKPADGQAAAWSASTPWVADAHAISWLIHGDPLDPILSSHLDMLGAEDSRPEGSLYPDLLADMLSFAEAIHGQPVTIELVGPDGSGRRRLALDLATRLGMGLIAADASSLLRADVPNEASDNLVRLQRSARLAGAALYLHHADATDPAAIAGLVRAESELWIIGREASMKSAKRGLHVQSFRIPLLGRAARIALWSRLSPLPAPQPVAEWLLTPADIQAAAWAAPAGPAAVVEACRWVAKTSSSELFSAMPRPYTWDDMVVTPGLRRHLAEFEAQARLRWDVYEDWGFGSLCPLGRGVSALFSGPSGSGKTMATQVIARELGMDLYRVDLAGVVNKYIGETEKRLRQVFDACERANVLLLFDEADALFGQRTQVREAHDRFANIEIDYLLQRMEEFDGIAILATNRKGDLDRAFIRRLRFIVDFVHPGPSERRTLWWKSLVDASSSGTALLDTIDWDYLAQSIVLSAAEIKQAALAAAFLACDEGSRIGMRHVLAASRRQLAKQGVELRGGPRE